MLLTNLAALHFTLSIFSPFYCWYGSQTVASYSINERFQKSSSFLKLLCAALHCDAKTKVYDAIEGYDGEKETMWYLGMVWTDRQSRELSRLA